MTEARKNELETLNAVLYELLDFFATGREIFENMTEREYWETIDEILDQINSVKKVLKEDDEQKSK